MKLFAVLQLVQLVSAVGLLRNHKKKEFPPESCSCACCTVQPDGACNMPGPQHWKHEACTYGLCGNAHVRGEKGNLYVQNKKKEWCIGNCMPPSGGGVQGDSCECRNGHDDNWECR